MRLGGYRILSEFPLTPRFSRIPLASPDAHRIFSRPARILTNAFSCVNHLCELAFDKLSRVHLRHFCGLPFPTPASFSPLPRYRQVQYSAVVSSICANQVFDCIEWGRFLRRQNLPTQNSETSDWLNAETDKLNQNPRLERACAEVMKPKDHRNRHLRVK